MWNFSFSFEPQIGSSGGGRLHAPPPLPRYKFVRQCGPFRLAVWADDDEGEELFFVDCHIGLRGAKLQPSFGASMPFFGALVCGLIRTIPQPLPFLYASCAPAVRGSAVH